MITGAHVIVYTKDPEADRDFFKEIFGFDSVDAGHGGMGRKCLRGSRALLPPCVRGADSTPAGGA